MTIAPSYLGVSTFQMIRAQHSQNKIGFVVSENHNLRSQTYQNIRDVRPTTYDSTTYSPKSLSVLDNMLSQYRTTIETSTPLIDISI